MKPSSKMTLKKKWYHGCGCCDDSWNCGQLKKHATDKYFENSETVNLTYLPLQKKYITITIVERLVSTWTTSLTEILEETHLRLSIEWFESNLRSFGYFKCSTALWLPPDPSCKGNLLTRAGWSLQAQFVTWLPK